MSLLHLIKYLLNINNYNKYIYYIKITKEDKEIYYLYKSLTTLITKYNRDITFDEYSLYVLQTFGNDYKPLLSLIESSVVSDEIIQDVLSDIVNKKAAFDIAQAAIEVSEGKRPITDLNGLLDQANGVAPSKADAFVTSNLEALSEHFAKQPGLRWRLDCLNRSIGSIRKGDFGFIFARPETGKTTFLASEVSHFAEQSSGPILWFNNEEQGEKVMLRIQQASLGLQLNELFESPKLNKEKFYELTKDNIKIIDSASIHKTMVHHLCKEYSPSLVVFDQIDKIKGFDGDRNDLRLGAIYIWAREIAKSFCPVIGVCQADGTGEGKKWLTMDNVADAKTSKQAEADWILGIGKTHEPGFEYIRHLNISKNKLTGDEDSDPSMRHGKMDVLIEPNIARYKDIL